MTQARSRKPRGADGAILAARAQAWLVTMLSLAADAYGLGEVLGAGAELSSGTAPLQPAASVRQLSSTGPATVLAADIFATTPAAAARAELCARYAQAGVAEYWQIDSAAGRVWLHQLGADGRYATTPPDRSGMHYALLAEEFAFPVDWFNDQPNLLDMMNAWGLIDDD